jgi:hypothetical protein
LQWSTGRTCLPLISPRTVCRGTRPLAAVCHIRFQASPTRSAATELMTADARAVAKQGIGPGHRAYCAVCRRTRPPRMDVKRVRGRRHRSAAPTCLSTVGRLRHLSAGVANRLSTATCPSLGAPPHRGWAFWPPVAATCERFGHPAAQGLVPFAWSRAPSECLASLRDGLTRPSVQECQLAPVQRVSTAGSQADVRPQIVHHESGCRPRPARCGKCADWKTLPRSTLTVSETPTCVVAQIDCSCSQSPSAAVDSRNLAAAQRGLRSTRVSTGLESAHKASAMTSASKDTGSDRFSERRQTAVPQNCPCSSGAPRACAAPRGQAEPRLAWTTAPRDRNVHVPGDSRWSTVTHTACPPRVALHTEGCGLDIPESTASLHPGKRRLRARQRGRGQDEPGSRGVMRHDTE